MSVNYGAINQAISGGIRAASDWQNYQLNQDRLDLSRQQLKLGQRSQDHVERVYEDQEAVKEAQKQTTSFQRGFAESYRKNPEIDFRDYTLSNEATLTGAARSLAADPWLKRITGGLSLNRAFVGEDGKVNYELIDSDGNLVVSDVKHDPEKFANRVYQEMLGHNFINTRNQVEALTSAGDTGPELEKAQAHLQTLERAIRADGYTPEELEQKATTFDVEAYSREDLGEDAPEQAVVEDTPAPKLNRLNLPRNLQAVVDSGQITEEEVKDNLNSSRDKLAKDIEFARTQVAKLEGGNKLSKWNQGVLERRKNKLAELEAKRGEIEEILPSAPNVQTVADLAQGQPLESDTKQVLTPSGEKAPVLRSYATALRRVEALKGKASREKRAAIMLTTLQINNGGAIPAGAMELYKDAVAGRDPGALESLKLEISQQKLLQDKLKISADQRSEHNKSRDSFLEDAKLEGEGMFRKVDGEYYSDDLKMNNPSQFQAHVRNGIADTQMLELMGVPMLRDKRGSAIAPDFTNWTDVHKTRVLNSAKVSAMMHGDDPGWFKDNLNTYGKLHESGIPVSVAAANKVAALTPTQLRQLQSELNVSNVKGVINALAKEIAAKQEREIKRAREE